ncbi:hypothetical protein [Pseudochrobactrum asaccharolyticum]|uniref:DnaA-like protein n=1 Tax=Pseudochrobactrum asaccharolyticum TaxID=354351 RepID=A0A366DY08_9HYPH|nr:hypothetical protein [Pseudochrobactrum asaccharolyticum]RBO94962.1 hypothetical protein DFR47_104324 [Pseudochrobactrum asaccharolyticum]
MSEMRAIRRAAGVALKGIRFALSASKVRPTDRRSVEIYLLVTVCGISQPLTADVCGCTKQNVSKLLRAVEDRRDDQTFEAALSDLEYFFTEGV